MTQVIGSVTGSAPEEPCGGPVAQEASHRTALADGWSLWRLAAVRSPALPVSLLAGFAVPQGVDEPAARERSAAAARAVVREPAFLEAVTWQNAALVRNWLGEYAARVAGSVEPALARRDQREAMIAFLAQRYCAKNETIGFFGPVAWARFVDTPDGLRSCGGGGLRRRSLFVEAWAVDAVAASMAAAPELADHLVVRRNPVCDLSDGLLRRPRRSPEPVTGLTRTILEHLGAPLRAADLVAACAAATGSPDGRAAVVEELGRLRASGVVLVGLPIPVQDRPELRLRAYVEAVPDVALRGRLTDRLDGFDAAVEQVRRAAGDPPELLGALDRLDGEFSALSGGDAGRDTGRRRFGRALVYEDCRRDLDVVIGADLLDRLREPLALVLDSARWFVAETGVEVEADLMARYRTLRSRSGADVPLCDLVLAAGDVLNGSPGTAVDRVGEDLVARWGEVLSTAAGSPPTMRSDDVRPLVRMLFPERPVGWRAARQHSPDLLLRMVPTPRGPRPQWVLGELHLALNTLENRPFLTQADDPDELLRATAADFPDGRFVPVYPLTAPEVTSRTYPPPAMDLPDRYRYWSYTADDGHPAAEAPLPGAGLLVRDHEGRLVVRPSDGRWRAPLLEVLGEFLSGLVVDRFRVRDPAPHLPRLLLDDLVIARESWRLPVASVPLPPPDGADYGYSVLRAWLAGRGMPRLLFARTKDQPKPYLVDCDAPLSLRNLARALRAASSVDTTAHVTFVEMLPGPDELWLADAEGRRYTSELRVVAVDDRAPGGPLLEPVPLPAGSSLT